MADSGNRWLVQMAGGLNMKPRFTANDELIKQTLQGIYKSNPKLFFTISDNGEHTQVNLTAILRRVGATHENIDVLLRTFPFPLLAYQSERMKAKAAAKARPKVMRAEPDEEQDQEEEAVSPREPRMRAYQVVRTSSGFWGIFSNDAAQTTISGRTQQDAERELATMLKRQEPFSWAVQSRRNLIDD
jgi:hypothetical protein